MQLGLFGARPADSCCVSFVNVHLAVGKGRGICPNQLHLESAHLMMEEAERKLRASHYRTDA